MKKKITIGEVIALVAALASLIAALQFVPSGWFRINLELGVSPPTQAAR